MAEFFVKHGDHIAYALIMFSFMVKDIIWLRCLSIAASSTLIGNSLMKTGSSWTDAIVLWNLLFMSINVVHVSMIVFGERRVRFSEDEEELYETMFANFTKLEFQRVLRLSLWINAKPGDQLATEGEHLSDVMLISDGVVEIRVGDRAVATVRDGQFIGEMSYLTRDTASASAVVIEPTKLLAWPKVELRSMLKRNPSMLSLMTAVMGADVSRKLRSSDRGKQTEKQPGNQAKKKPGNQAKSDQDI